jgi:putative PIN family toxin of toxin-antitoxin system
VPTPFRVVLDTNILLRGLLNMQSAAGRVVQMRDRRDVLLLLSKPVVSEYRDVLMDADIIERYPELTSEKVEVALRRLRYVGEMQDAVRVTFDHPRDPKDAKFIELAIAARATHIVSGDKDLLALASGHGDAKTRFRQRARSTRITDAVTFLRETSVTQV